MKCSASPFPFLLSSLSLLVLFQAKEFIQFDTKQSTDWMIMPVAVLISETCFCLPKKMPPPYYWNILVTALQNPRIVKLDWMQHLWQFLLKIHLKDQPKGCVWGVPSTHWISCTKIVNMLCSRRLGFMYKYQFMKSKNH